jgi:hypothetical protein
LKIEKLFTGAHGVGEIDTFMFVAWFFTIVAAALSVLVYQSPYLALLAIIVVVLISVVVRHISEKVGTICFCNDRVIHLDKNGELINLTGWYWKNNPILDSYQESINFDTRSERCESFFVLNGKVVERVEVCVSIDIFHEDKISIAKVYKKVKELDPNCSANYSLDDYLGDDVTLAIAKLYLFGNFNDFIHPEKAYELQTLIEGELKTLLVPFGELLDVYVYYETHAIGFAQ